jgi:hypothetical protein
MRSKQAEEAQPNPEGLPLDRGEGKSQSTEQGQRKKAQRKKDNTLPY